MEEKEYLIEILGNEALLEDYIEAIENGYCRTDDDSYCTYHISNEMPFLKSSVVEYFFQTRRFNLELYQQFFEKLRKIDAHGFGSFSDDLKSWIHENITKKYYVITEEKEDFFEVYPDKPHRNITLFNTQDRDKLKFVCYVATCHMKYGASYESVTAHEYLEMVGELDPNQVKQLKQFGSQKLGKALTFYQDKNLECYANDVFATIDVIVKNENSDTYAKALKFIIHLLQKDFPRSFSIELTSPSNTVLNINELPICGQNYLFAAAVQYTELHEDILEYIKLSQKQYEWYRNIELDDECAMPSTFAVFALTLNDVQYFPILEQYLKVVDGGHQSIQQHLTIAFVEKYGVTDSTFPLFIKLIRSMEEHPPHPIFIEQFKNEQNLELLLKAKQRFDDWEWSYVLYSIFGEHYETERLKEQFDENLWTKFLEIRAERGEDFKPEINDIETL